MRARPPQSAIWTRMIRPTPSADYTQPRCTNASDSSACHYRAGAQARVCVDWRIWPSNTSTGPRPIDLSWSFGETAVRPQPMTSTPRTAMRPLGSYTVIPKRQRPNGNG